MYETGEMGDRVKGLAIALNSTMIEALDKQHRHPRIYKREEMYLLNADLGPIYRPPIKAWVYTMVLDENSSYKFPNFREGYWVAANMYLHRKLAAADVERKVSHIYDY